MPVRQLPDSLISVLRRVQELEALALGTHRERAAVRASGVLLLAAFQAGWQQAELAAAIGMPRQTVQKRIESARQLYDTAQPALVVDEPPARPPTRLAAVRQVPSAERDWLMIGEAATHAGRSPETIRNWLARGILPNTDREGGGVFLYFKPDLDRIVSGPKRGKRAVYPDFRRLQEAIAISPA